MSPRDLVRWSSALVTAFVAAGTIAACGGSGGSDGPAGPGRAAGSSSSAAAASSPASLTATLLAVNDRLAAQTSYVVTTSTADGLTSTLVHDGEKVSLDETSDYGHFEAVRSGDDVWVRKDNAQLWRRDLESPSAPAAAADVDPQSLVGRWVLVTGTRLASAGIPTASAPPVFSHPDDTTVGDHATVHGVDTVVYTDRIALVTVYLSTGDEPLPIKVESTASSMASTAYYSEYGSAPTVTTPDPATVVDGTGFLPV